MLLVYVGPIATLATTLQGELAEEHDFLAKIATHSVARAQSLKAGRALLKYALRHQGLLTKGELLPPIVISDLGKPHLQWPASEVGAVLGQDPESPPLPLSLDQAWAQAQVWDFNLSHANGLIALSLGQGSMGIDIECCTRKHFQAALCNELMCHEERLVCAFLGMKHATNEDREAAADALFVAGAGAENRDVSPEPLSATQLHIEESELNELKLSPAWAHIAARKHGAALNQWQRQCLWWTQQWTVRECALKVLGKSIFAHKQIGFDLPYMQVHLAGMPLGSIHCYRLLTTNKIDAPLGGEFKAEKGAKNGAISPFLLLPQASTEAEYVLSIFVPRGEKVTLNLWLDNNWHETSLTASCLYQILPT